MRRYFLGYAQSEERFVNYKIDVVYIFYMQSIVGNVPNLILVKYGGTLPAFKYEIKDFFFTRLGTGGIFSPPLQQRTHASTKKYLKMIFNQSQGIYHLLTKILR